MKKIFLNWLNLFGSLILYTSLMLSCGSDSKNARIKSTDLIIKESKNNELKKNVFGLFYLFIPEHLELAKNSDVKIKYPGKNRPKYVYTANNMGVNLGYSEAVDKDPFTAVELSAYLKETTKIIKKTFGEEMVSQSEMDTINGIPFAIIEFYSTALDGGRIYNLVFTTSVNNKKVTVSFNCIEALMPEWEDEVSQIFSSISLN